jgi:uncharacterized OB-fold protein
MVTESWPSRLDYDTAAYWQGLSESKLVIARCQDCGHWIHPPRACCPTCWSDDIGHESPTGQATLYSYVIQQTLPGEPMIVAWAELAEQRRLLVVAELQGATPKTVRIGAALTLEWAPSRNVHLPVFRQEP